MLERERGERDLSILSECCPKNLGRALENVKGNKISRLYLQNVGDDDLYLLLHCACRGSLVPANIHIYSPQKIIQIGKKKNGTKIPL